MKKASNADLRWVGVSKDQPGSSTLVTLEIAEEKLQRDLEHFRGYALELGASMAQIIPADWVEVDERVRLKCASPLCRYYNKNLFCPPNGPPLELVRNALKRYHQAILFALDVKPVEIFCDRANEREAAAWAKKGLEIVGRTETLAYANGYHLAMGFCQASCNKILCRQPRCLVLDGGECPFPLKARPSMEGVGIDVFALATKAGWDIYPIYRNVDPKAVARALSVGIVFIH